MTAFKPDGWHTLTPRILTEDVAGLVDFLATVFNADGSLNEGRPTDLKIGDSYIMVSDGGGVRDPIQSMLYIYVEDADETYQRAMTAGAVSIEVPSDMPYGDRRATIRDPAGNIWQIATYRG